MTKHVTFLTLDDAEHFSPEERERIAADYPAHEREARAKGVPMLGSGRVFPVAEEGITCAPFKVPDFYACIGGMDFGWDHPFGAVKLAWDRDDDVIYVAQCYRAREETPAIHVDAIKPWGPAMPWAWPHDGHQHDKGSGEALAGGYRRRGLNMLPEHATHEDGGFGTEAGITQMLEYMQAGRFKVFSHLADWFEEFRLYHRKAGKIVKEADDLLSATRIAVMSLRFAKPRTAERRRPMPTHYNIERRKR